MAGGLGFRRRGAVMCAALAIVAICIGVPGPARAVAPAPSGGDWPAFGRGIHHDFHADTTLDAVTVHTLVERWFFPTGDAVTAQPIAVGDTVYVGSWDGWFYAIDRTTGEARWQYKLDDQPAITPVPGTVDPARATSDGGLVTASAWFEPARAPHPDLVIFAAGYTLYAVVATGPNAGKLFWKAAFTGLPEEAPAPATDSARIFSSPVVVGNKVIFGVAADGEDGHRGYLAAANVNDGSLEWRFETDVNRAGAVQNDGCGGVWSSPSVDRARGLAYVGVADCHNQGPPPYSERVLAVRVGDGSLAWVFTPPRLSGVAAGTDPACDFDFGATANLGDPDPVTGRMRFLGIGGKDGTYYRLDPGTGARVWSTRVVYGGVAGGFIGTTAYDGSAVYGATGLGDVGGTPCDPADPADAPVQEPSMHRIGAGDGVPAWSQVGANAVGATTVGGGLTFTGNIATAGVNIRDAGSGTLLHVLPAAAATFGAITVVGDEVVFGTGAPEQQAPDGVYLYATS